MRNSLPVYDSLTAYVDVLSKTIYRHSCIGETLLSQCHAVPQVTVFHLNLALYNLYYLLT